MKDNQPTLHQAVVDHLLGRWEEDFAGDKVGRRQTEETGHGRRESRTYIQLEAPESLPRFQSWRGLKSIGVVISETQRERDGKTADEVRYFISSLPVDADAKAFAHAIRSHWNVESWNPGAEHITGYREEEVLGRCFTLFYTEEDVARQHPQNELKKAAEVGRFEDEGWRVRRDGTKFWVNAVITALYDEHRALKGFAKITRDVTERKRAEERLIYQGTHDSLTGLANRALLL